MPRPRPAPPGSPAFHPAMAATFSITARARPARRCSIRARTRWRWRRARAVIEKVAAMAGWKAGEPGGAGRGRGIAFARYKNRAAYCAVVVELDVEEMISL